MAGVTSTNFDRKKNDYDQYLLFLIILLVVAAVLSGNGDEEDNAPRRHTLARLTTRICIQIDKNSLKGEWLFISIVVLQ